MFPLPFHLIEFSHFCDPWSRNHPWPCSYWTSAFATVNTTRTVRSYHRGKQLFHSNGVGSRGMSDFFTSSVTWNTSVALLCCCKVGRWQLLSARQHLPQLQFSVRICTYLRHYFSPYYVLVVCLNISYIANRTDKIIRIPHQASGGNVLSQIFRDSVPFMALWLKEIVLKDLETNWRGLSQVSN